MKIGSAIFTYMYAVQTVLVEACAGLMLIGYNLSVLCNCVIFLKCKNEMSDLQLMCSV